MAGKQGGVRGWTIWTACVNHGRTKSAQQSCRRRRHGSMTRQCHLHFVNCLFVSFRHVEPCKCNCWLNVPVLTLGCSVLTSKPCKNMPLYLLSHIHVLQLLLYFLGFLADYASSCVFVCCLSHMYCGWTVRFAGKLSEQLNKVLVPSQTPYKLPFPQTGCNLVITNTI